MEYRTIPCFEFSNEEIKHSVKEGKILSLDIELSRACNLKCRYCYAEGKAIKNELSLDELKDVIDQAVALGAKSIVNIGGGEPMMYKHYWEILEYEREKGLASLTVTNGSFLNEESAKRLREMNEHIVLKFNSFSNEKQDYLAQKEGTGAKIKSALKYLLKEGYTQEGAPLLVLESLICKHNYDEIEQIYKFCREKNIIPYIETLTDQGLAQKENLGVSKEKTKVLFEKLQKYDREEHDINWALKPPIVGQECKRVVYSVYVRSDGNIQPCPGVEIIDDKTNIRNHSLDSIVNNSEVFTAIRNIHKNIKGECATCEHEDCYGCRGNAFFINGDYLAEDPTCWYVKDKEGCAS